MTAEFINALNILKEWVSKNEVIHETKQWTNGEEMIESESLKFNVQPISAKELEEIKIYTEHLLPESYYYFLSEIGSGQFFIGEYFPCFEMYGLGDLKENNALVQKEIKDGEINDNFIMIGMHCSMGDWVGFCTTQNDKNYDVFCHEYPIDEYVEISDELKSWRTFEEWFIKAIETKGKETL